MMLKYRERLKKGELNIKTIRTETGSKMYTTQHSQHWQRLVAVQLVRPQCGGPRGFMGGGHFLTPVLCCHSLLLLAATSETPPKFRLRSRAANHGMGDSWRPGGGVKLMESKGLGGKGAHQGWESIRSTLQSFHFFQGDSSAKL